MIINDDYRNVLPNMNLSNYVLVTDPPFNIGYHYSSYKDKMKHDEYFSMLKDLFFMFDKRVFILYPESMHELSIITNSVPNRICSWVYNSNTAKQHRDIAFYGFDPNFKKRGQDYKNPNDKRVRKLIEAGKRARLYDWWNINQIKNVSKEKTDHPCQMPLEVMLNIIGCLPDGVCVCDPFAGSGTTLVAAKKLGYDYLGIEIDSKYFHIAKERLDNV